MAGNLVYMSPLTRMLSLSLGAWLAVREFENRPFYGWPSGLLTLAAVGTLIADFAARKAGIVTSQGLYWTIALISYAMLSLAFTSTAVFDNSRAGNVLRGILSIQLLRGLGRILVWTLSLPPAGALLFWSERRCNERRQGSDCEGGSRVPSHSAHWYRFVLYDRASALVAAIPAQARC